MTTPKKIKAVVHVGVHKTGTSALQHSLTRNAGNLIEQGFLYSLRSNEINHSYLAAVFLKADYKTASSILQNMYEEALMANAHTVIISSEMFSEHPLDISRFKEIFSAFDIEIIAYLRRSDQIIVSAYNELVRDNVSRWATRISERLPYDPTFYDVIGKWLGDPTWKFVIAPYDRPQWVGGTLLSDFLTMVGANMDNIDLLPIEERVNKSLPPQLTEILRRSNKLTLTKDERDNLINILFRIAEDDDSIDEEGNPYTESERKKYCELFTKRIDLYQRYFRDGFDVKFLLPEAVDRRIQDTYGMD